jgi:hypothetical protein
MHHLFVREPLKMQRNFAPANQWRRIFAKAPARLILSEVVRGSLGSANGPAS